MQRIKPTNLRIGAKMIQLESLHFPFTSMLEEDKKSKVLAFNLKFSVNILKITRLNNKEVKQHFK